MTDTRVHPLAPVVALDLDGTLAQYHEHFTWFASLYLQETLKPDWSRADRGEFSEALGLEKHVYRDIKLAYRQGGMKRSIPAYPDVKSMVVNLRARWGLQVWIATTRPWLRLDNIDPDTQFWIQRNLGRIDGLIYGEDKYSDLIDIVGQDRILGVVDDLPENVIRAEALGLPAIIRSGPHNAWWINAENPYPGVEVADSTSSIYHHVTSWAERYAEINEGKR